jgi:long-chain acyl-CoA synthetase
MSENLMRDASLHNPGLFGDIILRNACYYPDRDAFIEGDRRINWREYNLRVNRLIRDLNNHGIKKGDVIGVLSWNCVEYADVFGAAGKGGFVIAPFNSRLSEKEIEYLIEDSGALVLFVGPEFTGTIESLKPKMKGVKYIISFEKPFPGMEFYDNIQAQKDQPEPQVEVLDNDPTLLLYTSGTTGVPKGALYTQLQQREAIVAHSVEMPLKATDKGLLIMPYFHIGGTIWHFVFLYRGVGNFIVKFFEPEETLKTIQDEKITCTCVVPTHLAAMLDVPGFSKYDTSSLNRIKYVGSPMPVELLKKCLGIWGPIFYQGYGQTETGPDITILHEEDHDVLNKPPEQQKRLLSCGRPEIDVQVRIVDENGKDVPLGEKGEIIVRGRHLMEGYWKKPEETKKTIIDGWLYTRDIGYFDSDGYVYLADRKADMIISGGENIYPREVEEVLNQHPAVLECAVFGIPDPRWVEKVHATVSLKKGQTATTQELIDFCKARLAKYKAPKSMEIVPVIPKSGTGKILKKELRKKFWDK